jgi:hypothetical protein
LYLMRKLRGNRLRSVPPPPKTPKQTKTPKGTTIFQNGWLYSASPIKPRVTPPR